MSHAQIVGAASHSPNADVLSDPARGYRLWLLTTRPVDLASLIAAVADPVPGAILKQARRRLVMRVAANG
jgi:hypothetical protein